VVRNATTHTNQRVDGGPPRRMCGGSLESGTPER
jgi:hypothetical protein